jgi:hypothetical protein
VRGGIERIGTADEAKRTAPAGAIVRIRLVPSVGEAHRVWDGRCFRGFTLRGGSTDTPASDFEFFLSRRRALVQPWWARRSRLIPPYAGAWVRQLTKLISMSFVN